MGDQPTVKEEGLLVVPPEPAAQCPAVITWLESTRVPLQMELPARM